MTHTAKILQLLETHTHCRNSAVPDEPGCINTIHDDRYCRYSEYTADILSPWWLILSARIYVASDYPGCINSAIPDDPFRKNSTIPDDPYCKNSATSEDPYSLQKFGSRWWTRLHKYNPWWPILQIFWTPDDPYSVQKLCSLWLPRLHKFYNQWWPNRAQKLCNPCKPILL